MASDADADGRPLVVFTFSDFDPAGHQMPISIGRKLQALRDLQFPNLSAEVVPVSLTLEQVIAERLPTTPVKKKEQRRDKWDQAFGAALREAGLVIDREPAQVEIDALATIRPDMLRRITHEKIALYRDETIARRVRAAEAQWRRTAEAFLAPQIEARREPSTRSNKRPRRRSSNSTARGTISPGLIAEARGAFEKTIDEARRCSRRPSPSRRISRRGERPDVRDRARSPSGRTDTSAEPPGQLQAEIDVDQQAPIIRLDWSFEDVTAALKAHKAYEDDKS